VWASLIMLASTDAFSADHTRSILESFFHWLFPSWTSYSVYKAHLVVRKCAHFFEYAVLAIFVMRGLAGAKAPFEKSAGRGAEAPLSLRNADPSTPPRLRSGSLGMTSEKDAAVGAGEPAPRPTPQLSLRMTILSVVLLCAVVATVDEVHQHFVPSRTGSAYDVMLDTAGSTFAMLVLTWQKRRAAVAA